MSKETLQNDRVVKTYIDAMVEIISKAKIEKMIVSHNSVQIVHSQPVTELLTRIDNQLTEYVKDYYPNDDWSPFLKRSITVM